MGSCKKFIGVFCALLVSLSASFSTYGMVAKSDVECTTLLISNPLVKIDPSTTEFLGLTEQGLEVVKSARDVLRERIRLFQNDLRNLDSVHHLGLVARLTKGNMLIYGPPGGAKSMLINWIMSSETNDLYKLQLHQMITEQAFVGGQNFESAKEGRFEINTKGSLVEFSVGLIDEFEKGNPAALASLLSLLNEREVLNGNKVIKARLETLFATSNANLPEILDHFIQNGMGTTAPALLNRFQFKAFVYNWLSIEDQALLDQRRERRSYLQALSESDPSVKKDEVFLQPEALDWTSIRHIARTWFKTSPLFKTVFLEFVNDMRNQTITAIRSSEERHRNNQNDEPFVYFPSADLTERLRQQIPEVVVMSAFLDFLESPLADDASLKNLSQKQIELDPLSLWRASLVMTTVGPGNTHMVFDPTAADKINIDFDWSIEPSSARDRREELMIKNLKDEQERFRLAFIKHIAEIQSHIELRARNSSGSKDQQLEDDSFELLMLKKGE